MVHMNAGVSSEKEKVKESQSRSVTPSLNTPSGAGLGASHFLSLSLSHVFLLDKNEIFLAL